MTNNKDPANHQVHQRADMITKLRGFKPIKGPPRPEAKLIRMKLIGTLTRVLSQPTQSAVPASKTAHPPGGATKSKQLLTL
jgi:hypothetical protein